MIFLTINIFFLIFFALSILLSYTNIQITILKDNIVFLLLGAIFFMPFSIIESIIKLKQRKLFIFLKKHSKKVECEIINFSYHPTIGYQNNHYHYRFKIKFKYFKEIIIYQIQTNNKDVLQYKYAKKMPIYYLPIYCEYLIGRKTQTDLFKSLGFKIRLKSQSTYPMIIYEGDLQKSNYAKKS